MFAHHFPVQTHCGTKVENLTELFNFAAISSPAEKKKKRKRYILQRVWEVFARGNLPVVGSYSGQSVLGPARGLGWVSAELWAGTHMSQICRFPGWAEWLELRLGYWGPLGPENPGPARPTPRGV